MDVSAYSKPIRDKPQSAGNGDERPNRENAAQPAVLQAIQTQPQSSQHNERAMNIPATRCDLSFIP